MLPFISQVLLQVPVLWLQRHVYIACLLHSSSAQCSHHCGESPPAPLLPFPKSNEHVTNTSKQQKNASSCFNLPYLALTDGVGVQDLFHHGWTQDTSAEEKGPSREERKEWLIPRFMSIHGARLEELRISYLLILTFGKEKQISCDLKGIVVSWW